MVLADTSVWIQHFRRGEPRLADCLSDGLVLLHPMVVGELSCGNLRDRGLVLDYLERLPQASIATHAEVRQLVDRRRLWGRGLGWMDVHLLASALLSRCRLWTLDKRLDAVATELGLT